MHFSRRGFLLLSRVSLALVYYLCAAYQQVELSLKVNADLSHEMSIECSSMRVRLSCANFLIYCL